MRIQSMVILLMSIISLLLPVSAGQAADSLLFSLQAPYFLGKSRSSISPGEQVQVLFSVENRNSEPVEFPACISLPPGWIALSYDNWQLSSQEQHFQLRRTVKLAEGFDLWFDLLTLRAPSDLQPGSYPVNVTAGNKSKTIFVKVAERAAAISGGNISLQSIVFPLDKDGRQDGRLEANILVLRDRQQDYYKNLIAGKGVSNQEKEAVHPLAFMALDVSNPAGEQKLVTINVNLVDAKNGKTMAGLFTPGATGEDLNAGSIDSNFEGVNALLALNGEQKQRLLLPIYADERLITGGEYLLQVRLEDGINSALSKSAPLKIIKQDTRAAVTVAVALMALTVALLSSIRRFRRILAGMKTAWLVSVALFGAVAFAAVNIPSTLLGDIFQVLLGPFSVLVSGLFNGVLLYMIIVSLVVLIPRPGVVALMLLVRLLLGALAFGRFTPVSLLACGIHALLLETFLQYGGVYRMLQADSKASRMRLAVLTAVICGLADSIASYVGLQAMAFLYRMYYADWYIFLLLAVNSFVYTAVGALCGVVLGRRLSEVGGD